MNHSNDETSAKCSRIPPSNFNLIDHPFRPTDDYMPLEGLREKVQALHNQGRLRSALDEIFKALAASPDHPEALMLAMLIVGTGRPTVFQVQEPLPDSYLRDRRLDSIFTVCSHCQSHSWVPTSCLLHERLSITNPVGVQCYNCGYVVCRECLQWHYLGIDISLLENSCPNCHQEALSVPVFPTGRLPSQMARQTAPLAHVLVFREGPIPPDGEYIQELLESVSPDALAPAGIKITAFPVPSWPDDMTGLAGAVIAQMESDGKLPLGSLHSAILQPCQQTQYGTREYIVKVPQPTSEQTEDAKRQADESFQEGLAYQVVKDEGLGFLEELVKRHIVRLRARFAQEIPLSQWHLLIRPAILSFTLNAIDRQIRLSMQDGTHHYLGQQFSDAIVVVSVVPAVRPSQAMTYFPGGYLAALVSLMNEYQFRPENAYVFIHWIFCLDSSTGAHSINLSFVPPRPSGMLVLALDLLSREEKMQLPKLVE